ncbi:MAG: TMEM175 family protein [Candidatus Nanogingivalis sp.]
MKSIGQRWVRAHRYYHSGEISIDRLESLADGFIAIIITLMVLEVPVPSSMNNSAQIMELLHALVIYFASFVIVGLQWTRHHRVLEKVQKVTNSFIWKNLLFLFSLSLIPLFMKWMIKNPNATIPALSYAIVYFVTEFCIRWVLLSSKGHKAGLFHRFEGGKAVRKKHLLRLIFNLGAIVAVIAISFWSPQLEIFFLIFLPVLLALSNVFADEETI